MGDTEGETGCGFGSWDPEARGRPHENPTPGVGFQSLVPATVLWGVGQWGRVTSLPHAPGWMSCDSLGPLVQTSCDAGSLPTPACPPGWPGEGRVAFGQARGLWPHGVTSQSLGTAGEGRAAPAPLVVVTLALDGARRRGHRVRMGWADGQALPSDSVTWADSGPSGEDDRAAAVAAVVRPALRHRGPWAGLQDSGAAPRDWRSLGGGHRVSQEGGTCEFRPRLCLKEGGQPSR